MHVLERFIYWLTHSGVGQFLSTAICTGVQKTFNNYIQ